MFPVKSKPVCLILVLLALALLDAVAGCGPTGARGGPSGKSTSTNPFPLLTTATAAPQNTKPNWGASQLGSVVVDGGTSGPELDIFVAVQNNSSLPQVFTRIDINLYGGEGRLLGVKSWGSHPITLQPGGRIPVGFAFSGVENWTRVGFTFPDFSYSRDLPGAAGLSIAGDALVRTTAGAKVTGVVQNAGSRTATDVVVLAVGYDGTQRAVAWAYSYAAPGIVRGDGSLRFETGQFVGDPGKIASYQVIVFGQPVSQ